MNAVPAASDAFLIRAFRPDDAARCSTIISDALAVIDGLNDAAREFLRRKNTSSALSDELSHYDTLVCLNEGRIVGLGAWDGEHHEIKRVYVDPADHGRGVGRAMMNALEARARDQSVLIAVVQSSPNAVPFYRNLGYQTAGRDTLTIGDAVFEFENMTKVLG